MDNPLPPVTMGVFEVRPATADDAPSAVEVLRSSIIQLCVSDHRNDPSTLDRWLRNKTVDHFCQWIQDSDCLIVVAVFGSTICGVGAVRKSGDLDLCYVQPGNQRKGVGKAILRSLEAQAMDWGIAELQLISTAAARSFYERHGYLFQGHASVPGYRMVQDYDYRKRMCGRGQ